MEMKLRCVVDPVAAAGVLALGGGAAAGVPWQWYSPVFLFVWHPFLSSPPPWASAADAMPKPANRAQARGPSPTDRCALILVAPSSLARLLAAERWFGLPMTFLPAGHVKNLHF